MNDSKILILCLLVKVILRHAFMKKGLYIGSYISPSTHIGKHIASIYFHANNKIDIYLLFVRALRLAGYILMMNNYIFSTDLHALMIFNEVSICCLGRERTVLSVSGVPQRKQDGKSDRL